MKTLIRMAIAAGMLSLAPAAFAQNDVAKKAAGPCATCAQKVSAEAVSARPVPGTNENMLVGRIENLIPIGILSVLGCEGCTAHAVAWALEQGSSTEDIERALKTIANMQNLDCFKVQFGPETAARLEKPLAAARKVLQEAAQRAVAK